MVKYVKKNQFRKYFGKKILPIKEYDKNKKVIVSS